MPIAYMLSKPVNSEKSDLPYCTVSDSKLIWTLWKLNQFIIYDKCKM